ncbi:hypothetical protein AB0A77_23445 [Streptomyces varsoviensis]
MPIATPLEEREEDVFDLDVQEVRAEVNDASAEHGFTGRDFTQLTCWDCG